MRKLSLILREQKVAVASNDLDHLIRLGKELNDAMYYEMLNAYAQEQRVMEAPEKRIKKEKRKAPHKPLLMKTRGHHRNMRVSMARAKKQIDGLLKLAGKAETILIKNRKKLGKAFIKRLMRTRPDISKESAKAYQGKYEQVTDGYLKRSAQIRRVLESMSGLVEESIYTLETTKPTFGKVEPIGTSRSLERWMAPGRRTERAKPGERTPETDLKEIVRDLYRGARPWFRGQGIALRPDMDRADMQQIIGDAVQSGQYSKLTDIISPKDRRKVTPALFEDFIEETILLEKRPIAGADFEARKQDVSEDC